MAVDVLTESLVDRPRRDVAAFAGEEQSTPHAMRGVFIFGVAGGIMRWGRMFLEPVDPA